MKLTVRRRRRRRKRSQIAAVRLAVGVKSMRSLPQQRGRKSPIRERTRARRRPKRIWKREAMNRKRKTIHQWWVGRRLEAK